MKPMDFRREIVDTKSRRAMVYGELRHTQTPDDKDHFPQCDQFRQDGGGYCLCQEVENDLRADAIQDRDDDRADRDRYAY